jgi:hypothetical protein
MNDLTVSQTEQILLESRSARLVQVEKIGDHAEEYLNKAKALHFSVWQGAGIATTEQVADFYEVPAHTVKSVFGRHELEFNSDGTKVIKGEDLESVRCIMHLTKKTHRIIAWNPRSTLRLGYLLRDSAVAKAVRALTLNVVEQKVDYKNAHKRMTAAQFLYHSLSFEPDLEPTFRAQTLSDFAKSCGFDLPPEMFLAGKNLRM